MISTLLRIGLEFALILLVHNELHSFWLTIFCLLITLNTEINAKIFNLLLRTIKDIEKRLSLLEER